MAVLRVFAADQREAARGWASGGRPGASTRQTSVKEYFILSQEGQGDDDLRAELRVSRLLAGCPLWEGIAAGKKEVVAWHSFDRFQLPC